MEPETLTFAVKSWSEVTGRGWLAAIEGIPGFDPRPLQGQTVLIDGHARTVRAVETFAVLDATGKAFGLLFSDSTR